MVPASANAAKGYLTQRSLRAMTLQFRQQAAGSWRRSKVAVIWGAVLAERSLTGH